MKHELTLKGKYTLQHIRDGKVIQEMEFPNGICDAGINDIFDVHFVAGTQIVTWYFGLIDLAGFSALADADTSASHAGWAEFTTYSEATRPAFAPGAPAAKAVVSTTPTTFNITGTATVKGIFCISNNTKSGSTGILWGTALFSSDIPVASSDQLKVTYTVSGA